MRLFYLILLGLVFLGTTSKAQLQDNNWCMGVGGGIDFSTNPPTKFTSSIDAIETTATVSDRYTGKLLFYTDGSKIWDATHAIMQNGTDIGLDEKLQSSAQGAIIVPFLDDETMYYVFAIPAIRPNNGNLYYSIVDMKLNGGLGGVVTNQKKIKIGEGFTESIIALPGCGVTWVVSQQASDGTFYAFKITSSGLNTTPVKSPLNYALRPHNLTRMKASPDYKRLAVISNIFGEFGGDKYLALHDFDAVTGAITNGVYVDTLPNVIYYDCEFSPSGQFLYVASKGTVYQYDVTLPTHAARAASKTSFGSSASYFLNGLQRRDDGNIYIVRYESDYLGRISNCDARAPNCVYTDLAVQIGGKANYNMPQAIVLPQNMVNENSTSTDTSICDGTPIVLHTKLKNIVWQDGSTNDSFTATKAGVYWARSTKEDCKVSIDSFVVTAATIDVFINNDTTICIDDKLTLRSNAQPAGTVYRWSNGSTADTTVITTSGRYGLMVEYNGCSDTDEVVVTHYPRISIELGNDTQICKGNKFSLPLIQSADYDAQYLWQDGSTQRSMDVTKAGVYYVTLANKCQTIRDTVVVTDRNCHLFFPSAFSPNGDGRNDIARMVGDVGALKSYRLRIFNRWGEVVYTTSNPLQGWDGNYKGQKAEVGMYYYQVQYKYLGEEELMKGDIMLVR